MGDWQSDSTNRRRKEEKEQDRRRRGGHQGSATQPWIENKSKKDKSPKGKGRWDNLRKAGEKQAKPGHS